MGEQLATFHFLEVADNSKLNRQQAARENAARPAVAELTYVTNGVGQRRVAAPLIFPVIFRDEPHFTYGSGVVTNPKPNDWHDPVGHVGVYRWKRDANGYFRGVYIWWRTEAYPVDATNTDVFPQMKVEHFLSFSGTAFKDLSNGSKDAAKLATQNPRKPGKPN